MAVIYKGGYKIAGVVRHGEAPAAEPQTIYLDTYEDSQSIDVNLLPYFSRAFETYSYTDGNTGGALFTAPAAIVGTAAGNDQQYFYEFVVRGSDADGSFEDITFAYDVVPMHGLQPDYVVDYDSYTAVFTPYWPERVAERYIGRGGNPGIMVFEEQMILEGAYQPGAQDNYIWGGALPDGFQISETGLVTGEVLVEVENPDVDMGTWELTVTSPFGQTATLIVRIEAHATI